MASKEGYKMTYLKSDMDLNDKTYKAFHLKGYVYIERYHTEWLKTQIKSENWGQKNKRLYYYLDHKFRINLLNKSIYVYKFNEEYKDKIAIFNLKLYLKNCQEISDHELYMILLQNYARKRQRWRLSKDVNCPCIMTKSKIKEIYGINCNDLPSNSVFIPKFYSKYNINLYNFNQLLRLMLNKRRGGNFKDIIVNECKRQCNIDVSPAKIEQCLSKPFINGIKYSFNNNDIKGKNCNYVLPGIFFVKSILQYEVVYHMLIDVIYQNKNIKFVVILDGNNDERVYNIHKILTYEMGYCNARLINSISGVWFDGQNNDNIDTIFKSVISEYPKYCEIKRIRSLKLNRYTKIVFDNIIEIPLNKTCGYNHINFSRKLTFTDQYIINECHQDILPDLIRYNELKIESILKITHVSFNDMIVNEYCVVYSKPSRITNVMYYIKNGQIIYSVSNNNISSNNYNG